MLFSRCLEIIDCDKRSEQAPFKALQRGLRELTGALKHMHRIQDILIRDRLKFRFGLSKINVSGEKVSKLIDRTM